MLLGIRPTVDFAFKKIFGSPQNTDALLGLLNAILQLDYPVEQVEVLNPFSYQDFADNKLIVLDVRCRDSRGRLLNVEMQVSPRAGLIERLVYYACSMYVDQLASGEDYTAAAPAISICLLSHPIFSERVQSHHRFEMTDRQSGARIDRGIEVHTVELTKYNLTEATIQKASRIEQWVFLLLHAQDYTAAKLAELLPGIEFRTAINTIQTIAAKTEDKQMYDQREKAQRDYEWAMSGARKEGREEGREEGLEDGELIGKVRLLEELLGEPLTERSVLVSLGAEGLVARITLLQDQLRSRLS